MNNVFGDTLKKCASRTGWDRSGYCRSYSKDSGSHLVCAEMTKPFLKYTKIRGNDLSSVVQEGDKWCICAGRFSEAARAGKAPPIVEEATNIRALEWQMVEDHVQLQFSR
jgi:uncharacterized protein (DUF2237 family)